MRNAHAVSLTPIELALQDLQEERCACVVRLRALLRAGQPSPEAQGYMRRIENINEALIKLSRSGLEA